MYNIINLFKYSGSLFGRMSFSPSTAFSAYHGKGLTGLGNVGNSCYLNACVQILSHTYELSDYLEKQTYVKKINKTPDSVLLVEWDKLRKLMWSDNCTIAPWGFVKAVQKVALSKGRDLFTGHAQNDVQEFIQFLICLVITVTSKKTFFVFENIVF